jgi:LysM repeat protein
LVALFLVTLLGRGKAINPLSWVQAQVDAGMSWVQQLGERMDPNLTIQDPASNVDGKGVPVASSDGANSPTATPGAGDAAGAAAAVAISQTESNNAVATLPATPIETPVATLAPTATDQATLPPTATPVATLTPTATATNTPLATNTATVAATATHITVALPTPTSVLLQTGQTVSLTVTLTPTPSKPAVTPEVGAADAQTTTVATATRKAAANPILLPTNTPAATNTATSAAPVLPTATDTPVLLPTPTPVPARTYTVKAGDTLSEIADQFNISTDALMAANNLAVTDVYALQLGDILIIPSPDSPAPPADTSDAQPATATATAPQRTYTLQAGDTPLKIANQFGISVDELLDANNLSREDARHLRSGQVLAIPGANAASAPKETATEAPPAQPPTPTTKTAIRLDTPQLRSPEDNTQISCTGGGKLIWQSVDFMRSSDAFILHLGFVNGVGADGKENIVWVLEQRQTTGNTLWDLDPSLCSLAPQQYGRKWYWYVVVVDEASGTRIPASLPSAMWSFRWN